ncbi:hypothetical protein [Arthrobacter globiformis]|uniref:hypothetical protein n=1 Tax=Arthrobacter globiformis TaxID=1665 RepID=UPI0035947016
MTFSHADAGTDEAAWAAGGFAVTATDSTRVLTSGRTAARAPHGFGSYLRALGVETAAALQSS